MKEPVNQYIKLVRTKPVLIILGENNNSLAADGLTRLQAQMANFSETYCEIGSGSGRHLIGLAQINPKNFYLGIELRFKRVFKTAEKAERLKINNLLVALFDAKSLNKIIPEKSLAGIYINFPDPWEKRRRQKHRLLSADFLDQASKLLKPAGFIAYKSDHLEYFQKTEKIFATQDKFKIVEQSYDLYNSNYVKDNIRTEFESLFLSQGMKINYLKAQLAK